MKTKNQKPPSAARERARLGRESFDYLKPYAPERRPLWVRARNWAPLPIILFLCLPYGFFFALTAPYLIVQFTFPILILVALTIWALPDFRHPPTQLLAWLFFAFYVASVVWPRYLAIALPGLPWITMIRLTGFPLSLILLICLSVSRDFRNELRETLRGVPGVRQALIAFFALQFLSIALSKTPLESANKFLVDMMGWAAMFFTGVYVFRKPGQLRIWAAILWGMAVFVSIIGLLEYRAQHVLWAGHIPSFLKVDDDAVTRMLAGSSRPTTGQYRAQSTFTTSLTFAEYLSLSTPLVLHFLAKGKSFLVRVAAGASIPLIFLALLATDSRLGLLGFFMSTMFYLPLWALLKWRRGQGGLVAPAVVLAYPAMFLLVSASTFLVGRIRAKVWGTGQYDASNQGRSDQIKMGIPKILHNPIGHGVGRGAETLGFYQLNGLLTIDNYYLLLALEYGVVGLILYVGAMFTCIVFAIRNLFIFESVDPETEFLAPLSIAILNFAFIKSVASDENNHSLIFMLMAAVVALAFRIRASGVRVARKSVRRAAQAPAPQRALAARSL